MRLSGGARADSEKGLRAAKRVSSTLVFGTIESECLQLFAPWLILNAYVPYTTRIRGVFFVMKVFLIERYYCTERSAFFSRPDIFRLHALHIESVCRFAAHTAGKARARECVCRSPRTPQWSLWKGGLGGLLDLVPGCLAFAHPLLSGRFALLAVVQLAALLACVWGG